MGDKLHPELEPVLDFYLQQRKAPPQAFAHAPGLIESPGFFSVATLQEYLNNPLLNPDWVQLSARGKPIPLDACCQWKVVQTKKLFFMDKALIHDHLKRGAAVIVEGIDIMNPAVNDFIARVDAALPCALSNCEAFFSQRENEAYGGHCDSDDVLIVHLEGEKLWQVFAPQQRRYANNAPLSRKQLGRQIAEFTMRPGDALYVRAGVPHLCRTPGDYSLHLSFDLCDRTPNVEQITHAANNHYNHACENPYVPASKVTEKYIELLQSKAFQSSIETATRKVKNDALNFRKSIGRASAVTALSKFIKE